VNAEFGIRNAKLDTPTSSPTPPARAGGSADDESISVEYALDEDDIVALQGYYQISSPERRRFNLFFLVVVATTLALCVAEVVLLVKGEKIALDYGPWVVFFFLLWAYILRKQGSAAQAVKRVLSRGQNRDLFSPQRLTLSREEIQTSSPYQNTRWAWGAVEKVVKTDQHVFMFLSAMSALIVPRRAFRADADFELFFKTARDHQRTASPGNCRKCGYDLHGNQSGACPECGTPIVKTG
jgi:hypothetical protein